MTVYYNEIDPYAAKWLRNLIAAGHIADGVVDTRSIEDVHPDDLDGFTQCHFFAGIGVWSRALRRAGWPDDRPVWTGSCPCQPFSAAGEGAGFADERHLWPHWYHLIQKRRPPTILGEQVASTDAGPWLDLVQDDMEAMGHAFGAIPFPASGVGAPHIRDRLYWVADASSTRPQGRKQSGKRPHPQRATAQRSRAAGILGNADSEHPGRDAGAGDRAEAWSGLRSGGDLFGASGATGVMVDATGDRWRQGRRDAAGGIPPDRERPQAGAGDAGATRGFWAGAEWVACRDGKARPVEPGTFPLVNGAPSRVGRLRAYGNAIVEPAAHAWIRCVMESIG